MDLATLIGGMLLDIKRLTKLILTLSGPGHPHWGDATGHKTIDKVNIDVKWTWPRPLGDATGHKTLVYV